MTRRPPRSTRTDTLFPYTTLFRSPVQRGHADGDVRRGRVGEHLDLVELIDQVSPALVLQVEPAPGVRSVDVLGIGVARGDVVRLGLAQARSGERRVGKECVSTCRSRWSLYHKKKNRSEHTMLRTGDVVMEQTSRS